MGIFSKPTKQFTDFSAIGVDIHNHVLPGLDDGSPSMEESIKMLKKWEELGFRKVVTTPHVISTLYPNKRERIKSKELELRTKIEELGIKIELEATAEYQLDFEFLKNLEAGEMIGFGPRNYLLLELPMQQPSFSVDEMLFQTQIAGFEPIIAHPERYFYLVGKLKNYETFKNKGYYFQMNLNSLTGLYGSDVRNMAEQLIENNLIDFVGSDAHHTKHLEFLPELLHNKYFNKLLATGSLLNSSL